ncbi:HNH endonuclease (plasmid) [Haloferacaceae archaeon DSL9]
MGRNGYPPDWDRRRKAVYKRDNYTCKIRGCNARGGRFGNAELHCHHIIPKSRGGSHNLDNLMTLCAQCHSAVHGYPIGSQAIKTRSKKKKKKRWKWTKRLFGLFSRD